MSASFISAWLYASSASVVNGIDGVVELLFTEWRAEFQFGLTYNELRDHHRWPFSTVGCVDGQESTAALPLDAQPRDLPMQNVGIPSMSATSYCLLFSFPDIELILLRANVLGIFASIICLGRAHLVPIYVLVVPINTFGNSCLHFSRWKRAC